MSNGLFVLRDDLVNAKFQNESLSKELAEAKARESKALDDLQTIQKNSQAWRRRAELELQALDATLTEVRAKLLPTEEKLKETTLKLEHTENRADHAEAVARDAVERMTLAEKDAKEALDQAAALETKARERMAAVEAKAREEVAAAEARAREAVREYRSSPEFASEVREGAIDAFVQGFERCKRRLSRHFKLKALERFRAEDDEETSDAEAGDVAGKAAAAGNLATEAPTMAESACSAAIEDGRSRGQLEDP